MTTPVADPSFYADFRELTALKRDARSQDPQALREAARQFESLFTRMLLSSMRATSFGDQLTGSDQQSFYQGMFDDQLAVELSRGRGMGLADMLVEQLTRAGLASGSADPGASGEVDATAPQRIDSHIGTRSGSAIPQRSGPGSARDLGGTARVGENSQWRPASREEFVRDLWPHAQAAAQELGVDPSTLIAHAALETGWGRSVPCDSDGRCSFNLFGVKATGRWDGAAVGVRTLEFENGVPVSRTERFRAYDSPAASFRDYVALLRDNPRYASALGTGDNAQAFAEALQQGGYATDPAYAQKLAGVAQSVQQLGATGALKTADTRPITSGTNSI